MSDREVSLPAKPFLWTTQAVFKETVLSTTSTIQIFSRRVLEMRMDTKTVVLSRKLNPTRRVCKAVAKLIITYSTRWTTTSWSSTARTNPMSSLELGKLLMARKLLTDLSEESMDKGSLWPTMVSLYRQRTGTRIQRKTSPQEIWLMGSLKTFQGTAKLWTKECSALTESHHIIMRTVTIKPSRFQCSRGEDSKLLTRTNRIPIELDKTTKT